MNINKKYEIYEVENIKKLDNHILHRIITLKKFHSMNKGTIGGYIEKESNLSQEGDCWVFDNAIVIGNAKVCGNARICGDAVVNGNASIGKNAYITSYNDYFVVGPIGSRCDYITFYLDKDKHIWVSCGYFYFNDTIEKFKEGVHKDDTYGKEYLKIIDLMYMHFDKTK